jgi:hypothetical protein
MSLNSKLKAFSRWQRTENKMGKVFPQLHKAEKNRLAPRSSKHRYQKLSAHANSRLA